MDLATVGDMTFIDANHGWLLIDNVFSFRILKTSDAGAHWTEIFANDNDGLGPEFGPPHLQFLTPSEGFFTPNSSFIDAPLLHTTDGGTTWSLVNQPFVEFGNEQACQAFWFVNSQVGYAVGNVYPLPGMVAKTEDGGTSWTVQSTPIIVDGADIFFLDEMNGWICCSGGRILYTHDGGANWYTGRTDTVDNLVKIRFADAQTGWAVGLNGTILYTNNGGQNWYTQVIETGYKLKGLRVLSPQIAVAVGSTFDSGLVFITTNGGAIWQLDNVPIDVPLTSVELIGNTILVAGNGAEGDNFLPIFERSFDSGVNMFISFQPLPPGTRGIHYQSQFRPENGTGPFQWMLSGSVPPGLTIDPATGVLSGTPGADGTFNFSVALMDSQNKTDIRNRSLEISGVPMSFQTTTLPAVQHRRPFQRALDVRGGHTPYHFTTVSGALPPGVSINKDGILGGTPQQTGTFDFTLQVTDAGSLPQEGSAHYTLQVDPLNQAVWETQRVHNRVTAVHFFDEDNGIAIGWSGILLETHDGGRTWLLDNKRGLAMYNFDWVGDEGWMVDEAGIWHSTDRGHTWQQQPDPFVGELYVRFLDRMHGWVWGSGIAYTEDGGKSWHAATTPAGQYYFALDFGDPLHGFAGGVDTSFAKSVDGGHTWTAATLPGLNSLVSDPPTRSIARSVAGSKPEPGNSPSIPDVNGIFFLNANEGWVGTQVKTASLGHVIYHTTNGGQSWQQQNYQGSGNCDEIRFAPGGQLGWSAGLFSGAIRRTDNGGASWRTITYFSFLDGNVFDIQFLNENVGYAAVDVVGRIVSNVILDLEGAIWKTTDGGFTWHPVYSWPLENETANVNNTGIEISGPNLVEAFFLDASHGWALGQRSYTSQDQTRVYYTENGGVDWKILSTIFGLHRLWFTSPTHGFGLGGSSNVEIVETRDGGKTWFPNPQFDSNQNNFSDIIFVDSEHGWTIRDVGVFNRRAVFSTADGGRTWNSIYEDDAGGFNRIFFVDRRHGWIVNTQGHIDATTDGGMTWNPQQPFGPSLESVFFVNELNGWAAGPSGNVLRTTDGGMHWNPEQVSPTWEVTDIFFNTCTRGFMGGSTSPPIGDPLLLDTHDGSFTTATQVNLGVRNNNVQKLASPDGLNVWGFGDFGINIKYSAATNALGVATDSVPTGRINTAYADQLTAAHATGTATWSVCGGSLPEGVMLDGSGMLHGTPTEAGTFRFVAAVMDDTQESAGKILFLTIEPAVSPTIVTTTLPDGQLGQAYVVNLEATGTQAPYEWDIVAGGLPSGLEVRRYGQVAGFPQEPGDFVLTIRVTDDRSPAGSATREFMLHVGGAFATICTPSTGLALPTTVDFTTGGGDAHGWLGGPAPGFGGTTSIGASGLCMDVPGPGVNQTIWVSPEQYIELLDSTVYRARLTLSTSQSATDAIPLFFFIYDNFVSSGGGNNFGGSFWVLDVDGGAEGIGRTQGRTAFDFYIAPNAFNTPQWRTGAFTPAADCENDIRLQYRIIDANDTLLTDNDSGTICVSRAELAAIPRSAISPISTVYNPPIADATHFAAAQDDFGVGTVAIDDTAHTVRYQLSTAGDVRRTFGPFNPSAGADFNSQLFPVLWEGNTLYRMRMAVRAEAVTDDPVEVLFTAMDTATVELGMTQYTTRGAPVSPMDRIASPAIASAEYEGYFYSQNATQSTTPNAGRLRPLAIFFNSTTQGTDSTGGDALIVESLAVDKLTTPP